jgi:hypothetical protein
MRRGAPPVPPELQRAQRLMDAGEYAEAALVFDSLAKKAEDFFPERAPFLYLQAGQAAMLNGDSQKGVARFRSGLTLLATQQRYHRLQKAGRRIVDELRGRGFNAEADEVETVLGNNAPVPADAMREADHPQKRGILPTHCPSCGAAVRPDEVEWLDEQTAECDYCGSPVRAED